MPNYVLFGQNDHITTQAAGFRRSSATLQEEGGFGMSNTQPYYEFVDENGDVVAMLNEYQYGNIIREDALLENR
jgi:hypothetical protein